MNEKTFKHGALAAAALALVATCVSTGSSAYASAPAKPRTSASIYVSTSSTTTAYNEGYSQGQSDAASPTQNSEVILDFGGQNSANTGSILTTNGTVLSYSQIVAYAENYALGYYVGTGSDTTSVVKLGIGTNNSAYNVSSTGGSTWANSVLKPVQSYLTANNYASQVFAVAANDMEPSWNTAAATEAWMKGFSGTGVGGLVNFGSADGCSQSSYANAGCNNSWKQYDVWYVSWGNPAAYGLPEIYYTANATQWTEISHYGYSYQNGAKIGYDGPMTEYASGGTLSNSSAWTTFYNDLAASSATAVTFSYSTDI